MASERYSENLVLDEMGIKLGKAAHLPGLSNSLKCVFCR